MNGGFNLVEERALQLFFVDCLNTVDFVEILQREAWEVELKHAVRRTLEGSRVHLKKCKGLRK